MSSSQKITPYFLLNLNEIRKNFLEFKCAIDKIGRNDIVAYAIKANYNPQILATILENNGFFEVSTYDEFLHLKHLCIPSQKIIINGCVPNTQIMKEYSTSGALLIIDSTSRLQWLQENQKIGIRFNLDHIKLNNPDFKEKHSRLGIPPHIFSSMVREGKIDTTQIICVHAHLSNNSKDPYIYSLITDELCKIIKENNLPNVRQIDVGGGYKIAQIFWSFKDYLKAIVDVLKQHDMEHLQLIFEPGNSIARTSMEYRTKIIDKKEINNNIFLIVDGTKHHVELCNKPVIFELDIHKQNQNSKKILPLQSIAGCSCKASDIFITLQNFLELDIGDEIVFKNTGAYTPNQQMNFLIKQPQIYTIGEKK